MDTEYRTMPFLFGGAPNERFDTYVHHIGRSARPQVCTGYQIANGFCTMRKPKLRICPGTGTVSHHQVPVVRERAGLVPHPSAPPQSLLTGMKDFLRSLPVWPAGAPAVYPVTGIIMAGYLRPCTHFPGKHLSCTSCPKESI